MVPNYCKLDFFLFFFVNFFFLIKWILSSDQSYSVTGPKVVGGCMDGSSNCKLGERYLFCPCTLFIVVLFKTLC